MEGARDSRYGLRARRLFWFGSLWLAGVGGATLLALPIRILAQAAMR